jgi:hypothetical protein
MLYYNIMRRRSEWPRGLRRMFMAARLLRSWVRIPPEAWMFVCFVCVLSGRGLCDELIARSEEADRVLCAIKKPRGRGGHSPSWAAEPEKINKY